MRYHSASMRTAVLLFAVACQALAGCLSFAGPAPGSRCSGASSELEWLNPSGRLETAQVPAGRFEETIRDPALSTGVWVTGDLRFRLKAAGPHIVEIFLADRSQPRRSFTLELGGRVIDARHRVTPGPVRLSPGGRERYMTLIGTVAGGAVFQIRTDSPRYLLQMVRWTAAAEFESAVVAALRERAGYWAANPIFGAGEAGASTRRNYLEQIGERLAASSNPAARREGLLALARSFYWLAAENHQPYDIARTAELFEELLRIAPEDPIVRQMVSASCLGINVAGRPMATGPFCEKVKPVPWTVEVPEPPPGAPAWAVEQRKLARRMNAITAWWVDRRQRPNGELGGGWGDDVEILRHWGPLALGFGSEAATRGLRRLAEGLWSSGQLLHGYDRRISDVEHSSEPTTDTQPLLAAAFPEDPAPRANLKETAACSEHWIARQPDGRWRFRGAWFNCREIDPAPHRALDVHLNTRAMGPALWAAYLGRDPVLIERIANWAGAWVEAMRSTRHGKPAGIFPPVVKSADGEYLVGSMEWDKPVAEWDYFQWSGAAQEALASLVLAAYDLTGERKWLEAAGESFAILDRCGVAPRLCEEIRKAPQAFYEWRKRSGDSRYDRFFGYAPEQPPEETLRRMAEQARQTEARLAVNFDMFTSEVIWTDRVYYPLPAEYKQCLFGGEAPRGDRYPTFTVTWPPAEGEFARAVLRASGDTLHLAAYNFEARELEAEVRLWRLRAGRYRWESRDASGAAVGKGEQALTKFPETIRFRLPPRREVRIALERLER